MELKKTTHFAERRHGSGASGQRVVRAGRCSSSTGMERAVIRFFTDAVRRREVGGAVYMEYSRSVYAVCPRVNVL